MLARNSKVYSYAFTLVELLVVISILGILASIALVAFSSAQIKGRDAQRKSNLSEVSHSLEIFYADYQVYPKASANNIEACPYTPPNSWSQCVWGATDSTGDLTDGKTVYFKGLPKDPTKGYSYLYRVSADQSKYQIFAHLENTQDPSLITTTYPCGTGVTCNFGISSPNTSPTDSSW